MNFFSAAWDDAVGLVTSGAKLVKDIIMAPAEIARWALGEMFGGGEDELNQIAAELAELGKEFDKLGQDINSALGQLTWHGPAADAFVNHAQGRVREISGVADELDGLSQSVKRLASF
ncbi:WXG100 family type VII secretion target [Kitasatospora sp. NPDC096147]|uniref:WXG100 family type VII secretion target n=1 Tax=Kitasatospora sp. NPDC096147 TaxID=3364093 RepID=UPI003806C9E7